MRLLGILLALALAGCTTPGDADDADNSTGSDTSSNEGIDSSDRDFLINLGGPEVGPVPPAFDLAEFVVKENATGLFLEAAWSCATPTCALDLVLLDEGGAEVSRTPGNGLASAFLEAPPAGSYQFGVTTSDDVVAQADGRVGATAFYGQPMPEGFSIFEGDGDG